MRDGELLIRHVPRNLISSKAKPTRRAEHVTPIGARLKTIWCRLDNVLESCVTSLLCGCPNASQIAVEKRSETPHFSEKGTDTPASHKVCRHTLNHAKQQKTDAAG